MLVVRRRDCFKLLGGAAASVVWPRVSHAQRPKPIPRVAVLMGIAEHDPESDRRMAAFRQALQTLGWTDGLNVQIDYRWAAGQIFRIEQYAEELMALRPDVVLANGTPAVVAFQKLTKTIPIVCALVNDPVGLGLVASLSRPGGNITGFTFVNPELLGKWVELLKQVAPEMNRAILVFNPKTTPYYFDFMRALEAERPPIDVGIITASRMEELEAAVLEQVRKPGAGLMMGPDPFTVVHIQAIARLTQQYRLPAISVYRQFAAEGGLMSYGPDTADIFRRSASYIDRILRGAKPAELPIQQPVKFELFLNLNMAKMLDLTIPATTLAIADEVIE